MYNEDSSALNAYSNKKYIRQVCTFDTVLRSCQIPGSRRLICMNLSQLWKLCAYFLSTVSRFHCRENLKPKLVLRSAHMKYTRFRLLRLPYIKVLFQVWENIDIDWQRKRAHSTKIRALCHRHKNVEL